MKIVIDIPDEQYELISNRVKSIRNEISHNGYSAKDHVPAGWVAIADGSVLPKGHGDLIDRSKITLSNFECVMCNGDFKEGLKMYIDKVDRADAVVPAETVEVD